MGLKSEFKERLIDDIADATAESQKKIVEAQMRAARAAEVISLAREIFLDTRVPRYDNYRPDAGECLEEAERFWAAVEKHFAATPDSTKEA